MERPWILALDAEGASIETVGGKGANLAQLAAQGFSVPPGFVVTTAAYRAYVAENDLEDWILSTVSGLPADDPEALESASLAIRSEFVAGHLSGDLAHEVLAAYASLGRAPVAVRSSATAEDLPGTSFAGQQDTYLNVIGDEALLQALVNCWSSLWTARAIGYRAHNAIAPTGLALAVVVQEMVPSQASGVLFTANPLTGNRSEMVIESTLGLGEGVVSGQVEPDRYVVSGGSGQIQSRTLGAKAVAIQPRPGGGTIRVSNSPADSYALPDAIVDDLARLGREVVELFNSPQDIEWSWDGDRLYLLQSRPITSLFPLPADLPPEPLRVLISFGAVQGILGPITPLGQDTIKGAFAGAAGLFGYHLTARTQRIASVAASRLFLNVTPLLKNRLGRRILRFASTQIEPGAVQALDGLLQDPRLVASGGLTFGTLRRIVPVFLPMVGRLILCLLQPDAERERFQRQIETAAADLQTRLLEAATLGERLDEVETLLERGFRFILPKFVPRFGAAMASLNLLNRLAAGLPEGQHDVLLLTRGLPHNVTTEMDLALWDTARRIRADREVSAAFDTLDAESLATAYLATTLPPAARDAIDAFLQRYGMRGVGEIDLGRPRWDEDPTPVMQVLQSYLRIEDSEPRLSANVQALEDRALAPEATARAEVTTRAEATARAPDIVFARGAAAAEAGIERLAGEIRKTRGGWFKARLVRWAARRLRTLAGLRETPKFWVVRMMGIARAALLASGRDLVESGRLAAPDDLFFLHFAELRALAGDGAGDWQALVCRRREAYAREQQRHQVPRLLLSDGRAFYAGIESSQSSADQSPGQVLAGSPVSPGTVEGLVRVILDPQATRLAPGEILVCPGTDPAWTPLFLVAAGLVTEVGGLMTHGSVVAREYGIPAVVGVSHATTRLQTGQRVRLDGSTGEIVLLSSERSEPENQ